MAEAVVCECVRSDGWRERECMSVRKRVCVCVCVWVSERLRETWRRPKGQGSCGWEGMRVWEATEGERQRERERECVCVCVSESVCGRVCVRETGVRRADAIVAKDVGVRLCEKRRKLDSERESPTRYFQAKKSEWSKEVKKMRKKKKKEIAINQNNQTKGKKQKTVQEAERRKRTRTRKRKRTSRSNGTRRNKEQEQ